MRRGKMIAAGLAVCAVGAGITVNAYAASTTFEMRKKAVSLLGIMTMSNYQKNVTRGEFAEFLVKASDYKETANVAGTVSVFADVSSKSQYSAAIRTAFPNGSLRHRPRIFIFLFYDQLPALQKMLLLALPFPQRQGFFLCSGGGSTAGTVPPSREKSHTAVHFAM